MSDPSSPTCPACGTPLDGGACPRCLMLAAMMPTAHSADTPRQPPPPIETVQAAFPQLEIIGLIGQGGMGCVFKARQPKLNRLAALKLLPASLAERDAAFAGRFEREGQLLARLHHPNIVAVHDSGTAGEFFYLIMEYVDGVNLRQAMRARRFTPGQALAIVPHICDALQFAHDEGVLHRDIKPENILLDAKGRVKLADFGIAKLIGSGADETLAAHASEESHLTQSGTALGTPSYMSPEQRDTPADVDHRADIYSLGVVFYELLTGELPQGPLARPSEKSAADPRVDAIVQQALETKRDRRQHSAGEVKTQVETIAGSSGVPPAGQGAVSEGIAAPARFSRAAIWGAFWAPLFFVAFVLFSARVQVAPGEHQGSPWWLKTVILGVGVLGLAAPFGTTILGWIAVSQIRRSAGNFHGLWLALLDGVLFPLLVLTGMIGWFWHWVFYNLIRASIIAGEPQLSTLQRLLVTNTTAFTVLATLLTSLVVSFFTIRRVWRKVNQPLPSMSGSSGRKEAPPEKRKAETSQGRLTSAAPSNRSKAWSACALGLLICAMSGAPLLWSFMGAQEAIVLCGLALLLSVVLGLMGWRSKSGKFAALASGFGLLVWAAFTFNYQAPRPLHRKTAPLVSNRDQPDPPTWVELVPGYLVGSVNEVIDQIVPSIYGRELEDLKCFDFEANRFHSPPKALADELLTAVNREQARKEVWHRVNPELLEWLEKTGVDVVAAAYDSGAELLFIDQSDAGEVALPLKGSLGEIDPSQAPLKLVDGRLPKNGMNLTRTAYLGWPRVPRNEFFPFQTREGNRGVLQVTGITDDPYRGVKIRYKLVQKTQYEVSVQFGSATNSPIIKQYVEPGMAFSAFLSTDDRLLSISGQIEAPKNGKFPGTILVGNWKLSEAHKGNGQQGGIPVELELGKPFTHRIVSGGLVTHIITLNEKPAATAQPAEPQAAKSAREEPAVQSPTFGPVVERLVPRLGPGKACLLDFETGEFQTPPDDLAEQMKRNTTEKAELTKASLRWLQESGVDIASSPDLDTIYLLGAIASSYWGKNDRPLGFDDFTPAIVVDVLSGPLIEPERKPGIYSSVIPAGNGGMVFITSEGTMGVMEILGGANDPAGVQIRYKLLRGVKPSAEAMAAAKVVMDLPSIEPVKELKIPLQDLPAGAGREGYRLTVEPGEGDYILATLREYEGSEVVGEKTPVKRQVERLLRTQSVNHSEDIFLDSHRGARPSRSAEATPTAATDRFAVSGFGQQVAITGLDFSRGSGGSAQSGEKQQAQSARRRFKFADSNGDKTRTRIVEFELRVIRADEAAALAKRHGISLPDENVANWAITLSAPPQTKEGEKAGY